MCDISGLAAIPIITTKRRVVINYLIGYVILS